MTLLGALGAFFFKKASTYNFGLNKNFLLPFFIGGLLYFFGSVLNIILLKLLPYTLVYPLTSITYIWTLLVSRIFLSEKISVKKVLGVLLVVLGTFLLIL
ncbi:EamA family transporter [Paenibacillus polymyxa]|uniref:EamA family transporter n=1 Tax=Paenibacillus polymyxa TaxID=1406 RepID=UPI002AB36F37|nr:EamA family transporter [Paenibacillus polymyxa]MDY7991472.1 EamA family transporter [Paenibacillus polymyxa]MDY8117913.1 EamA family transporter [Paenibacillus polymyxa]